MKKRKMSKAMKGEFRLPESMIQHIQSFLGAKEAALSSVVSKSWYSAWSTRPNLDFNQRDFVRHVDVFWELMEKTMKRYEELNLKIESFKLLLASEYMSDEESVKVDEELIVKERVVKAMKIGTVDFNFMNEWTPITLPREVLASESLIKLSLYGCKIDSGEVRKISCSGLKSLSFEYVRMEADTLWDIVSSCPFIENLLILPWCGGPSLGSVFSGQVNLYQLYKLKSLVLYRVDVDSSFFSDLSSKFPFLKDLSLNYCGEYKGIDLSSHSLEYISFDLCDYRDLLLWAKCDVPNIRKFKLSSQNLPSLSFKTAPREWESHISLRCQRGSFEWFLKLNKLLDCLSLSRISLSLDFSTVVEGDVDFRGLPKRVVENLDICVMPYYHLPVIKSLFQGCRPKFIQYLYCPFGGNEFQKLLYKTLVQAARGSRSSLSVVQDLEEVNVELFEESIAEWRPLSWSTLLRITSKLEIITKVRLRLRWRPELSAPVMQT